MSWSLSTSGSKKIVTREVGEAKCYDGFPDEEKEQFARAKALILAEVANIPDHYPIKVDAGGSMSVEAAAGERPRRIGSSQVRILVEPIYVRGMRPED